MPLGAGTPESRLVTGESVSAVAAHGSDVIIGSDQGVSLLASTGATPIAALSGKPVRDLVVQGDVVDVATGSGVLRWNLATSQALAAWVAPGALPDDDVRALAATSDGTTLLAGTALGFVEVDAGGTINKHVADLGALPEGDVRAIAKRDGSVLIGH